MAFVMVVSRASCHSISEVICDVERMVNAVEG